MADKRGLVASYPFAVPVPEQYQPRNEERFRAQMAQANAEIYDRLANIETDVDQAQADLAAIPPPPVVPAFATDPEALDGTSPDTIISPATLKLVLDTLTELLLPTGAVMYFAGDHPPGWLNCDGVAVTSTYSALRDYLIAAGSPYGTSGADPLLPDLRGEFIRGTDFGRGVDVGRVLGSSQLDQIQRITGQLNQIQFLGGGQETVGALRRGAGTASAIWQGSTSVNRSTQINFDTDFDASIRDGAETRPRNVSLRACIKT
jgi:hypothetical protein